MLSQEPGVSIETTREQNVVFWVFFLRMKSGLFGNFALFSSVALVKISNGDPEPRKVLRLRSSPLTWVQLQLFPVELPWV